MLSKILTLYIFLRNPKVPSQQRWFIRFRYFGLAMQCKYLIKDYVIRKPYKVICFSGEFQQELLHAIPFAYWHHKNGTLLRTESSKFTKELYFFSPEHIEVGQVERGYKGNEDVEIPNAPHDTKLVKGKWTSVPFSEHFRNDFFGFEKELIVIANRYNTEWGKPPVSYFDLSDLAKIIEPLYEKYQIVYNRAPANQISGDNSEVLELDDEAWVKKNYPEVIFLPDLLQANVAENYNHLQLLVYANCDKFVSIHGGTATLASSFGGINLIHSLEGHEHELGEFENVFPNLSGCIIKVFKDKAALVQVANQMF